MTRETCRDPRCDPSRRSIEARVDHTPARPPISFTSDDVASALHAETRFEADPWRKARMSSVATKAETDGKPATSSAPSAAAPSPFPPIAEYAFLSNCHTGALV